MPAWKTAGFVMVYSVLKFQMCKHCFWVTEDNIYRCNMTNRRSDLSQWLNHRKQKFWSNFDTDTSVAYCTLFLLPARKLKSVNMKREHWSSARSKDCPAVTYSATFKTSPCGVRGGWSATGTGFSRYFIFPMSVSFPQ